MPIIKSAQKRVRVAKKAAVRNAKTKRHLKDAIKSLQSALKTGKKSVDKELAEAQSAIDTAVKKNVIHKNKAHQKRQPRHLLKALPLRNQPHPLDSGNHQPKNLLRNSYFAKQILEGRVGINRLGF
jgi:small subunit ribosomal protein S20